MTWVFFWGIFNVAATYFDFPSGPGGGVFACHLNHLLFFYFVVPQPGRNVKVGPHRCVSETRMVAPGRIKLWRCPLVN